VPTIYNLFGIDYEPNMFIGTDLFYKKRKNIVYFTDGTWYDGKNYSSNAGTEINNMNYINNTIQAQELINLNNMIISNDYYRIINENER
jgi:phosphoglycerol transferase MdoB-like AlkP superfamily enzyme